jgi:hypothetical protein
MTMVSITHLAEMWSSLVEPLRRYTNLSFLHEAFILFDPPRRRVHLPRSSFAIVRTAAGNPYYCPVCPIHHSLQSKRRILVKD